MFDQPTSTVTTTKPQQDPKILPPFNVVLLNDDDHTYDYVIDMLRKLFGHTKEQSLQLADQIHNSGRAIVDTTTKERAEFKQEQIHAFGKDPRLTRCQGSMSATIEPCA